MKKSIMIVVAAASSAWGQCSDPVRVREDDCQPGDRAGWAVGIDGDRIITGSIRDGGQGTDAGAAHVFIRGQGGKWKQEAKLQSVMGGPGMFAGSGVAIVGEDAFVGMPYAGSQGRVCRWRLEGGKWVEKEQLHTGLIQTSGQFGSAVAANGNWMFGGAPTAVGKILNAGSVSIYKKTDPNTWSLYSRSFDTDGRDGDEFGASVAVRGILGLVGCPGRDEGMFTDCGAAMLYYSGGSVKRFTAPTLESYARFGASVAVGSDNWIAVGAPNSTVGLNKQAGAVYLFKYSNNDITFRQVLTNGGGNAYKKFGWSVAMVGDRLYVGEANSGLVVPYHLDANGVWKREADIVDPDDQKKGHFGVSLATDGKRLVIGDDYDAYVELNFADAGAAYVLDLPPACPADTDGNGTLDLFDFLGFQNRFVARACEADLNQDGAYDFFDFLVYQNLFSAGCN